MEIYDGFRKRVRRLLRDPDARIKKIVPAGFRHLISKPLQRTALPSTKKPKPYEPGLYPAGKFYYLLKTLTGGVRGFELIPAMTGAALCYLTLYLALAVLLKLDEVKILTRQIFRKRKGA